jgi:hypothetical protein
MQTGYALNNVEHYKFGMANFVFVSQEQQGMVHVECAQLDLNQTF